MFQPIRPWRQSRVLAEKPVKMAEVAEAAIERDFQFPGEPEGWVIVVVVYSRASMLAMSRGHAKLSRSRNRQLRHLETQSFTNQRMP
jgi:hypothetical protein